MCLYPIFWTFLKIAQPFYKYLVTYPVGGLVRRVPNVFCVKSILLGKILFDLFFLQINMNFLSTKSRCYVINIIRIC